MTEFITAKSILLMVISLFQPNSHNVDVEQALCMATNIYHEARAESFFGQVQVAHTTLARVRDSRYPNTVCTVVKDAKYHTNGVPLKHKCAFSWFCDGRSNEIDFYDRYGAVKVLDVKSFIDASYISIRAINGDLPDLCDGANFYYNPKKASPIWAKFYTHKCTIGNHTFLKRESGSLL